MTDMIERVALAIYGEDANQRGWDNEKEGLREAFRDEASIAIEAVRAELKEAAEKSKAIIYWNALPECDPDDEATFEFGGTVVDWLDDTLGMETTDD